MYVCIYMYIHIYMFRYTHILLCIYICICVYIYIQVAPRSRRAETRQGGPARPTAACVIHIV